VTSGPLGGLFDTLLQVDDHWPWHRHAARWDALIPELSAAFANTPAIGLNAALERALERIGRALGASHSGLVDCTNPDGSLVFTHHWSEDAAAAPSGIETAGMSERLRRGETIRQVGETSLALVPLIIDDRVRAGLWLSARGRRRWPDLRSIAATLSLALRMRGAIAERHSSGALSAHVARVATVGGLAASLAHELNQPLTAIRSNAQTAQRYLAAWPVRTEEMLNVLLDIVADVTRAGEIIDRMRGLLKNGPPSVSAVDLNEVVRSVTKLLASDAVIRQVQVTSVFEPTLPAIRGDRVQIQQVVLNLLLNALEAMDRGSHSQRRIMVTTHVTDTAQAALTVRDTGPGLGPTPDRWFEPFHSTKEGGLGVGLSITRMIVEAHGGWVKGENNDIGGATFQVRLPTDSGILP
jgi:signal transduction histidine kinase